MKLSDYVLSLASGLGQNAVSVAVKLMNGDTLVESVSTAGSDEDGQWTHTSDGSPGRVYAVATHAGNTRRLYGARSHQLPGGWTEEELLDLIGQWEPGVLDGISSELAVAAPGGMFVSIAPGAAVAKGQLYRKWSSAGNDLAVPANSSGVTRHDNVIVRFTRTGNDKWKSLLVYEAGDLTLSETASLWEIALAQVDVPNGASAITGGMITNKRRTAFIKPGNSVIDDGLAQTVADTPTNTTTSYEVAASFPLSLPLGNWTIKARGGVNMKHSASGQAGLRMKIGSTGGSERELDLTTTYEQCVDSGEVTIDTDGSENITLDYRRIDAGTVSVRNPWIDMTARRNS